MQPILYKDIIIESILKFAKVNELLIEEKVNEHSTAFISGVLYEESGFNDIYSLNFESCLKVKAIRENEEIILFCGIPTNIQINCLSGVYHIRLNLKSYSYLES